MKKSLLLISLVSVTFFFSCKKDEVKSPYDTKFTTETPEESKAKVEDNAVAFVDQLDAMTSATGMQVLQNFSNLQSGGSVAVNPALTPLSAVSKLKDKSAAPSVFQSLKATEELFYADPVSFSDLFDSIAGKYTYNFETEEFDRTDLADQVVFEFPGKETDITNTASLTIDNFKVVDITDPIADWPEGLDPQLPASIKIDLKYNDESVAGMSFAASYQSNGMPTKVTVSVFVDDFSFTTAAVHSPYSSASWTNTLKFKTDILFETYIAAKGNWSEENIDNNTTEDTYTDDWGDTWTETTVHFEEIVKNANAHLILMNLKVVGQVDIKGLGDAIWALDENQTMGEEERAQAEVDAINKFAKLVVIYRDSNTKIAEAEAYVESEYDDYYQTTDYYPALRFVYSDGSTVDMETYVNSELDNFYVSMNDFIDNLNAEYDLNLGHVGPQEPVK
jgi:hypothetical protein